MPAESVGLDVEGVCEFLEGFVSAVLDLITFDSSDGFCRDAWNLVLVQAFLFAGSTAQTPVEKPGVPVVRNPGELVSRLRVCPDPSNVIQAFESIFSD